MDHYINEVLGFGFKICISFIGAVLLIIGMIGLIASDKYYVFFVIQGLMQIAYGVFNLIKYEKDI